MDKSPRYTTIPLDDEPAPLPPQGIPPPVYEATEGATGAAFLGSEGASVEGATASPESTQIPQTGDEDNLYKCQGDYISPPPYSVASAELPSYEEAQRTKIMEDEDERQRQDPNNLFTRDNDILGTDFMFFISFFVAFLFNWVGFLLLLCFCHTLAARYGALAGFGLSLAKWTLLVKHSTDLVSSENEWLWWIIMAFGVLICVRATLQYIHAKREWRLLNPLTQERLVFLY